MNQIINANLKESEVFVPVSDYPPYFISCIGRLYDSKTNDIIGGIKEKDGRIRVPLTNENNIEWHYIDELVLKNFGPRKPEGDRIEHINNILDDNDIFNLRWVKN